MTTTKIKLETFLLELIENAGAELKEEIEALEEGADIKTSSSVMRKIVEDLIQSANNFQEKIEEHSEPEYKFSIGEEVMVAGGVYLPEETMYELLEIDKSERYAHKVISGKRAKIIARAPEAYQDHGNLYAILVDWSKYFINESCLRKIH